MSRRIVTRAFARAVAVATGVGTVLGWVTSVGFVWGVLAGVISGVFGFIGGLVLDRRQLMVVSVASGVVIAFSGNAQVSVAGLLMLCPLVLAIEMGQLIHLRIF